jgi:predicted MFS family arabinose efflux permease
MNKRGGAFGVFNGVYGIMWFLGSVSAGWLYDHSVATLVAFGMAAQLASAVMFFRMRGPLASAVTE